MAQHDYSIANATGLNFRTDLNAALQAIATTNSGASEPTAKFAGMLWLDMSGGGNGVIKRRNATNTAWISDVGIDQIARDAAEAAQATADAALPLAGGTMTGAIVLPNSVPTGHQALSRTQADALYQISLPIAGAGALLLGQAGGWSAILPPGASDTILSVSGGGPTWQATTQTALPNTVVRTLSDGTIDPSFIPQVAAGLKFCGTFKPVVNDEYPAAGDGGHGALGAPAIGDFWVIDGLTTGGYTYLTGSLAGVTVINGDSIAYNGAGSWYRMGSSVSLSGYLKTDGSSAMTGALNMGSQAINNVGGLNGRAGSPVSQTNFRIDTTNIVISPQRGTTGADLAPMAAGQIGTDIGRQQIFVGTASVNQPFIAVPFHSVTAAYAANDYAKSGAAIWRARGTVSAGAFTASQWWQVLDTGGGRMEAPLRFNNVAQLQFDNPSSGIVGYLFNPSVAAPERLSTWTCDNSGVANNEAMSIARADGLITFGNDVKLQGGRLYGTALHNNASALTGAVSQFVGSGTYSPTFTLTTNAQTATAAQAFQWMRVGNVVTVCGQVNINPTAAGSVEVQIPLPIASNLTGFGSVVGVGVTSSSGTRIPMTINSDATSKRGRIIFDAVSTAAHTTFVQFTYLIL
jgi:hypothetical protein